MNPILGHDDPVSSFLAAHRGERPHHGWIFAGPEGIGKATLAKALATRLLAEAAGTVHTSDAIDLAADHPTASLIAARSHPDYRLVEREVWDKNNRERLVPYADRKGDEATAKSIRVAQIRWLDQIFAMAPSLSNRRVVVIDSADDFEQSAANALLKKLEEPPAHTIFILISHAPGRLLPTIRSRCRVLRFSALSDDIMTSILRTELPKADASEVGTLVQMAQGSPGAALRLAGIDIASLAGSLERIAAKGDPDNSERAALAYAMSLKSGLARYEAFLTIVPTYIAAQARDRRGKALGEALKQWEAARALAQHAIPGSLDPQAVALALAGHVAALAPPR